MTGRGSIRHNNRRFSAANVDRSRTEQNVTFCNDDLKQVYHEIFDEALEAYNAGKKKTRDKIPDYYEHIRQSKQEKLFHEAIFQIGNLNDCGCGTEGGQRAAEALIEYAKSFQERNPHLHVFNMVLHMDEATPHLHVDYIPVATEQTRGLSTRVSMKQALKQQGFTGVGRKQTEWKAWMDREKEVLTEIAQQHEFEIISLGSNRRHMELPEYRAAIQEAEAVQEQTAAALQELADMQEKKTELKGEIKSLSGTVAALKAAERVRVDFDTIQPEKTLTGAVKGVTVDQIRQLKDVAMTGAAAKQTVVASFSELTELRSRLCSRTVRPSETTRARFDEVCTRPGIDIDMRRTPSGHASTARTRRSPTARAIIRSGSAQGSACISIESSMPANSATTTCSKCFSASMTVPERPAGSSTTASASRGMALRRLPPLK